MNTTENYFKKAKSKLESSKILLVMAPDSSLYQSYYSRYCVAQALLASKNLKYYRERTMLHAFSYEFVYQDDFDLELYRHFLNSRKLMLNSLYKCWFNVTPSIAKKHIKQAEMFIDEGQRMLRK